MGRNLGEEYLSHCTVLLQPGLLDRSSFFHDSCCLLQLRHNEFTVISFSQLCKSSDTLCGMVKSNLGDFGQFHVQLYGMVGIEAFLLD